MTDPSAQTDPRGFSIMMPTGWSRYRVDAEGRAAFQGKAVARMKALGRPDLDVQLRLLISEQWKQLERTRAFAVYLPDEETSEWRPPVSIAARKIAGVEGTDFDSEVRRRFDVVPERIATPLGDVLRWRTAHSGSGELAEVRTVTLGYGFAAPVPEPRLGLVFVAVLPHPVDADPEVIEGSVELVDTIMETFRWR